MKPYQYLHYIPERQFTYYRLHETSITSIILAYIYLYPNCTRDAVQRFVYSTKKYSGYGSTIWSNLIHRHLIDKQQVGHSVQYKILQDGTKLLQHIYGMNLSKKLLEKYMFKFKLTH